MSYEKYKGHRDLAMDIYRSVRKEYEIEETPTIKRFLKNIEEEKFLLAVVGEVKAGKSTFINALLGEELMPVDVNEATSVVVEIVKSETKSLNIEYLNGYKEEIKENVEEIKKKLEIVAKVDARYKSIPFSPVNEFIKEKFREEGAITDADIDDWIEEKGYEKDKEKIKQYVEENKQGDKIPVSVEVKFPHRFNLAQLRIADTPGTMSVSGLGEVTGKYIAEADAIIYLHKGSESSQVLDDAWKNALTERAKENMFVVFTHGSEKTNNEKDKILDSAKEKFTEAEDRVFYVDSLTDLYWQKIKNMPSMEDVDRLRKEDEKAKKITAEAYSDADKDLGFFLNELEKQSRMNDLVDSIDAFSEKAPIYQLRDFVGLICEDVFIKISNKNNTVILKENKYKNPQEFRDSIEEKYNKEMEEISLKYNEVIESVKNDFNPYNDKNSVCNDINNLFKDKELELNSFTVPENEPKGKVKALAKEYFGKVLANTDDEIKEIQGKWYSDIYSGIKERVNHIDIGEFEYASPIEIPILKIIEEASESSVENKESSREGFFGWIKDQFPFLFGKEYKSFFSSKKFVNKAKDHLEHEFLNMKKKTTEDLKEKLDSIVKNIKAYTDQEIDKRKEELKEISDDNDQLKSDIESTKKHINELEGYLGKLKTISGELK